MDEPKLEQKIKFDINFFKKYIYVFVVVFIFIFGVSYGLTFFIQNKKVAEETITVGGLSVNVTGGTLNLSLVPYNDDDGLLLSNDQDLTIANTTTLNGVAKVTVTRTSGISLDNMRYALFVKDATTNSFVLLNIADVPNNGVIYTSEIFGNETIDLKVKLWTKESYDGDETTLVGNLSTTISLDNVLASNYIKALSNVTGSGVTQSSSNYYYANNATNNYVWFNCQNGYTEGTSYCSKWRIVGVVGDRVVVTNEYENATSRVDSELYESLLATGYDDSLAKSVSTDDKNFYLLKTVIITGGDGTNDNPYSLGNEETTIQDNKVIGIMTYKDNSTTVYTQPLYADKTNYISYRLSDSGFISWNDGTDDYKYGDTVAFTVSQDIDAVKGTSVYSIMNTNPTSDASGIDFVQVSNGTNNNGNGLFVRSTTLTDPYPITYYRGVVTNNNIEFGGFCWKMVRTTDGGGVKLIYNGIYDDTLKCNLGGDGTNRQITVDGANTFRFGYNQLNTSGYMYMYNNEVSYGITQGVILNASDEIYYGNSFVYEDGKYKLKDVDTTSYLPSANYHYSCNSSNIDDECESIRYYFHTVDGTRYSYIALTGGKNIETAISEMYNPNYNTSSIAKRKIDTWYTANIASYVDYLEDTVWCNDREIYYLAGFNPNGGNLNDDLTYMSEIRRLHGNPRLTCTNKSDAFTVKNKSSGNGYLDYPIALLTLDEAALAGGGGASQNEKFYLFTGVSFRLLSPVGVGEWGVYMSLIYSNGLIGTDFASNQFGLRPSISLKWGTLIQDGIGDGTEANPYRVRTS